ncbi:DUF3299 domain-containing protein [Flammeovirgaceae bacterium SG7u.111]|nr:DUF3299 domain-containing protein [Flammeovirgaceae bacterium SG7u.132]WPO36687.1 DUF3299 domain-containing protein [Flammeovirgaceae bacterium SG7u.111]
MKVVKTIVILFSLCCASSLYSQDSDVIEGWKAFAKVRFRPTLMEEDEGYLLVPQFGKRIKELEGKSVKLKGYVMPFDYGDENFVILSRYPYTSCFFCGAAGPESVAEIHFTETPPKFKPDEQITIVGELSLNQDNIEHMNFILEKSKIKNEWTLR